MTKKDFIKNRFLISEFFLISMFVPYLPQFVYADSLGACPEGHCSTINHILNDFCINNGLAGKPFPTLFSESSVVCTCPCSCVAAGTFILTDSGEKRVEELNTGDILVQPNNSIAVVTRLMKSKVLREKAQKVSYDSRKIIVSTGHPFVRKDGRIIAADQLLPGDEILDLHGRFVEVTRNQEVRYSGNLYNFITHPESTSPKDHLVITNGVQSGDFLVQSTLSSHDPSRNELSIENGQIQKLSELTSKVIK